MLLGFLSNLLITFTDIMSDRYQRRHFW